MKRLFVCVLLFALTGLVFALIPGISPDAAHSAAPGDDSEKVEKEITQLSVQWGQIFINKDLSFLKRIWENDFSYIMPDGTVLNKKAGLAYFADDTNTYTSQVNTAFKVRVYDKNFAVAVGDDHLVGKDKEGQPFSSRSRFTNVWVRRNGRWQVVAGHASKLE